MNYFALIGDFIDSKKISNRHQAQETLKKCLSKLNKDYEEVLVSKFSVTLGDEFQGLLSVEAPIFQIIDSINFALEPYRIRFGIGLGAITTTIDPERSIGADGPAYWYARQAINHIHQKNDYGATQISVGVNDPDRMQLVNTLIAASEAIKANWLDSQKLVLKTMLENAIYDEDFNQKYLAEVFGLTTSSLSKRLKSSHVKVYLRARKAALGLLQQLGQEEEK